MENKVIVIPALRIGLIGLAQRHYDDIKDGDDNLSSKRRSTTMDPGKMKKETEHKQVQFLDIPVVILEECPKESPST